MSKRKTNKKGNTNKKIWNRNKKKTLKQKKKVKRYQKGGIKIVNFVYNDSNGAISGIKEIVIKVPSNKRENIINLNREYIIELMKNGLLSSSLGINPYDNKIMDYYIQKITSIIIPTIFEQINQSTFLDFTNLRTVNFEKNSNLHIIGDNAFNGCINMTTIVFPNKLKKIGRGAFYKCINLKYVVIPASVEEIDEEAFSYNEVGNDAFGRETINVTQRSFVFMNSQTKIIKPSAFDSINESILFRRDRNNIGKVYDGTNIIIDSFNNFNTIKEYNRNSISENLRFLCRYVNPLIIENAKSYIQNNPRQERFILVNELEEQIPPEAIGEDLITGIQINVMEHVDSNPLNIVFIYGETFGLGNKHDLMRQIINVSNIKYECIDDNGRINGQNIKEDNPIFILNLTIGTFLVPISEIIEVIQSEGKFFILMVTQGEIIKSTVSENVLHPYKYKQSDPGVRISSSHCQSGQGGKMSTIKELILSPA